MINYVETNGNGTLTFEKCGMQIRDTDYNGDIGNHRIRTAIIFNGVKFYIEARSANTRRTTNARTGAPLKKYIQTSNSNGIHIEIFAVYNAPIKGCTGKWFMHEEETRIFDICTQNEHSRTMHKKWFLLAKINGALKTNFDDIDLV
jgi:hypothetical protein